MDRQVTDWLLQAQTPTIRYLTLVNLLGLPEDNARVVAQRQTIMAEGPVPAILAGQTPAGFWAGEHSFYTPKYRSTHWSLTLLAELLVDGADPRFRRGVEFMLGDTADRLRSRLESNELGWSCFYGNMLRYTCHAGLSSDERVRVLIDYTLRDMDNGYCRCAWNDGYACAWGVARTLWGLAALPQEQRDADVDRAVAQGLEFLLQPGRLPAADYPVPDDGRIHTIWSRLNFPLFYQADILFILRVLAELGALERTGAQEALAWLCNKRQKNGRWRGSNPYRSRTWPETGDPQETSRWVTLQAASLIGSRQTAI
jgi:hypothetical protein